MKMGKISESILKRSVLKQIKPNRAEIEKGAAVGSDCAFIRINNEQCVAMAQGFVAIKDSHAMAHAIHFSCNNLAAGGVEPLAIQLGVSLPENYFESDLKQMMNQAKEAAVALNVQITGGHTQTVKGIAEPIINVTATGVINRENMLSGKISPGQDIVMTKWAGISATAYLANEREEELLSKYPSYFIKDAKCLEQYFSIVPEAATAMKSGVSAMHDVSGSGVFGALWEMGESAGVGLTISLKDIPIKQETVEICDFFDLNPYELHSQGALLLASDDGYALVNRLKKEEIYATVIGKFEEGNDRVVMNEDEKRFLEPPRRDELMKLFE